MVPSLSAQNMECIKIGKEFMVSHGYIKNDFDVDEWAAPEFLEQAAVEVLKEEAYRSRGACSSSPPTPRAPATSQSSPRPVG
jgi:hypothetical protein